MPLARCARMPSLMPTCLSQGRIEGTNQTAEVHHCFMINHATHGSLRENLLFGFQVALVYYTAVLSAVNTGLDKISFWQ
jgi:hypothetical protein